MREIISCIRNLPKHIGTGFINVFRNGSMTIWSIMAVMITLGIMGIIGTIAININNMTINIESSLSIYVKLDRDLDDEMAEYVGEEIEAMDGIVSVTYSSKEDELNKMISYFGDEAETYFGDYHGDGNPLSGSYTVEVEDAEELETITKEINDIYGVNKANYGGTSTSTLVTMLENVRDYGSMGVVALLVVVVLLISSTIHITIQNRNSEVEIMRMVGASNWYIRIPFMIEGALIGVFGAVLPVIVICIGYENIYAGLQGKLMAEMLMLVKPEMIWNYSWILFAIGAGVGFIGATFAISKHLRK